MSKQAITKEYLRKLPDIRVGDTIKVFQKIKEGNKERVQVFEGLVLAKKHGAGIEGTITVKKVIAGVGVEKIFPLHSPNVEKFEIVSRGKVRRAKLYYLRERTGKKAKIKKKLYVPGEETKEEIEQETTPENNEKQANEEQPAN